MKNRKVTLAELNALNPCKPAESFLGETWEGTLLDILKDTRVKSADKIWAVTKLLDEKTARLFAVHCAREAVKNIKGDVDPRITNCIEVAEIFANGQATDEERIAAESAAWSAAESAARPAARYAAYAAWSAAESAAYAAYVAESAAYAAESVAYEGFVSHLVTVLSPKKAKFVKTNVKLGQRSLYMKVVVNE